LVFFRSGDWNFSLDAVYGALEIPGGIENPRQLFISIPQQDGLIIVAVRATQPNEKVSGHDGL
jgi:hypothetical protein